MEIDDIIRSVAMAAVGTVSYTIEKARQAADCAIQKGEEVAREKGISYEETRDQVLDRLRQLKDSFASLGEVSFEDILRAADKLDDEQRAQLISRLLHPPKAEEPETDNDSGKEQ